MMNIDDSPLEAVLGWFMQEDPEGDRVAHLIRDSFDQAYDGRNSGRYRLDQLGKTEKAHIGSLVEVLIQRRFDLKCGFATDYEILGHEVDCKYSMAPFGWMFPIEALDKLCLVVTADDALAKWSIGLIRVRSEYLGKPNRDSKRSLLAEYRDRIQWIHRDASLPANVLLRLPRETVEALMRLKSGQDRICQLLRVAQRMVIGRAAIETVGQQKDPMKRLRENGGARSILRPEGILVLIGDWPRQRDYAISLGLPSIGPGQVVSARVAQDEDGKGVLIDGRRWRLARDNDELIESPRLK